MHISVNNLAGAFTHFSLLWLDDDGNVTPYGKNEDYSHDPYFDTNNVVNLKPDNKRYTPVLLDFSPVCPRDLEWGFDQYVFMLIWRYGIEWLSRNVSITAFGIHAPLREWYEGLITYHQGLGSRCHPTRWT